MLLQKTLSLGILWDEKLPVSISERWKKWLLSLDSLCEFEIPRNCFGNVDTPMDNVSYQLHRFSDASNLAFSCVIYLRRLTYGLSEVGFLVGKSRLVLTCQNGWVISSKELEAAKLCSEMMLVSLKAFYHLKRSVYMWTKSQVVLKWVTNPDLHLVRFVKRPVDKILGAAPANTWNYVHTSLNLADVATRENAGKNPESVQL